MATSPTAPAEQPAAGQATPARSAEPARGLRAQIARAYVSALGRMDNPALVPLALAQAEGLVPAGANGLALLHELAHRPEWPARYLAARMLGERSAAAGEGAQEAAWPELLALASDGQHWVREGAAWGLGALLNANPYRWGPEFLRPFPAEGAPAARAAAAGTPQSDTPVAVRRALLYAVLPALRASSRAEIAGGAGLSREPNEQERLTEARRVALEVIDRAASDEASAMRQLGSHIVGREVAAHAPEEALALVERWAASGLPTRQLHAARALTPALREIDSARTDRVVTLLEGVPHSHVRAALRAALKGTTDAEDGPLAVADQIGDSATMAAPTRVVTHAAHAAPPPPSTDWQTTADIPVGDRLIDQVVGQDRAVEIIRLAALQKRFVLMVGEPGTGKSMLAAAMAEMMGADETIQDILVVPNEESRISPLVEAVPAGDGERIVREAKKRRGETETAITFLFWVASLATSIIAGWYALATQSAVPGVIAAVVVAVLWGVRRAFRAPARFPVPKLLVNNARARETDLAPMVDATGFHAGALLGDVRHDPFQSGGYETPPHELVEPGAIHLAHRGVLFIDEVSTLSIESQQSLLTAIQEKRFPISGRTLGSSGTMIRSAPAPCDFLLILAGNMQDVEKMHPALRSRVRGYGYELYMNEDMPDSESNREHLARFCAQEVLKDHKIPHLSREAVEQVVEEARRRAGRRDRLTTRLRELGGLVRAAGDLASQEGASLVERRHVVTALENTRTLEEQIRARKAAGISTPAHEAGSASDTTAGADPTLPAPRSEA